MCPGVVQHTVAYTGPHGGNFFRGGELFLGGGEIPVRSPFVSHPATVQCSTRVQFDPPHCPKCES